MTKTYKFTLPRIPKDEQEFSDLIEKWFENTFNKMKNKSVNKCFEFMNEIYSDDKMMKEVKGLFSLTDEEIEKLGERSQRCERVDYYNEVAKHYAIISKFKKIIFINDIEVNGKEVILKTKELNFLNYVRNFNPHDPGDCCIYNDGMIDNHTMIATTTGLMEGIIWDDFEEFNFE